MTEIYRVFVVDLAKGSRCIVDFLIKPNRIFLSIDVFNIPGHPLRTPFDIIPIPPATEREFMPVLKLPFVLDRRAHV